MWTINIYHTLLEGADVAVVLVAVVVVVVVVVGLLIINDPIISIRIYLWLISVHLGLMLSFYGWCVVVGVGMQSYFCVKHNFS